MQWILLRRCLLACWVFLLSAAAGKSVIFTVTSAYTSGAGSFHEMVAAAEATLERDTIRFQLPSTGPFEIFLDSAQIVGEQFTRPLFIDGNSQPFSSFPNRLVTFKTNGQFARFTISSSDVEVSGLAFADLGYAITFEHPPVPIPEFKNIRIHGNAFFRTPAVTVHVNQTWVHGIYFEQNYSEGSTEFLYIGPCCGRMDSIFVRHNWVLNDDQGNHSQYPAIQVESVLNGVFSYFIVEDNVFAGQSYGYQSAITIHASAITPSPQRDTLRDIWITDNQFLNDSMMPGMVAIELLIGPSGRVADSEISDVHIERNTIGGFRTGISIENVGGDSISSAIRNVVIADNDLSGIRTTGINVHALSSSRGSALIEGLNVHHNQIHHGAGTGILLQGDWRLIPLRFPGILNDNVFADNEIHDNGGVGIQFYYNSTDTAMWPGELMRNTFARNRIYGQPRGGIAVSRATPVLLGDSCELPTPELSFVSPLPPFTVYGRLAAAPADSYRIEYFANPNAGAATCCQAESYLGADTVVVSANGFANIAWPSGGSQPFHVSATATRLSDGTTGCISNFVDTLTVAILDPLEDLPKFQVYPNPHSQGPLWLECKAPISEIQLWNSLGQQVPCELDRADFPHYELKIGALPDAMYHIRLRSGTRWHSQALVIRQE